MHITDAERETQSETKNAPTTSKKKIMLDFSDITRVKYQIDTVRDITAQKQLNNEMARLESLNIIGEMAAAIGHEIRNPLTSIRGFLQILKHKHQYSEDKEYFQLMLDELDRASDIISEFLSLSKKKIVEFSSKNINDIIKKISPLIFADAIKSDKEIILDLGNIPELLVDEKEIRQLILNLSRNGLDAMLPCGILYIRTYYSGNEVILEVEDTGCGIPKEVVDKIGQPFITTKENGTGLGLSVCSSICERHHAKLGFKTTTEGTTFYVRFQVPKKG